MDWLVGRDKGRIALAYCCPIRRWIILGGTFARHVALAPLEASARIAVLIAAGRSKRQKHEPNLPEV
jgi:hypothetical protein